MERRGFVVREQDQPPEGWSEPERGATRWRTLISGDRTPTHALTLGVVEIASGAEDESRPHRHAQPEAYYVVSGRGVVTISGAEHRVEAGAAVFIPGGAEHCARCTSREPLKLLYVFPTDSFAEIAYEFPTDW